MFLDALPLLFILVGLVLYVVLGGADFGAGVWQLTAGRGKRAEAIREHAHHSIAPVWEANHVWLIFVLTVMWTAYPKALGSLASTLSVPLFLAGLGIIFRGAAYALRSGTRSARELSVVDRIFGIASLVTPFALGAALGGIASGRVPVGNAAGGPFSSWLGPTSVLVGVLAIVTGAHIAAVFLSGDAIRAGEPAMAESFRRRALGSGVVAGAVAVAGLVVVRADARPLFDELTGGAALAAVIVSLLAGVATLALVWRRRFEPARYAAALAVAAIVAGWAVAQSPQILPGLSVEDAAAPRDVMVAVVVAIVAGGLMLAPSLATLFRLALGGQLAEGAGDAGDYQPEPGTAEPRRPALQVRVAGALLLAGIGLVNIANADWAHVIGAACFLGFVLTAFRAALLLPAEA